MSNTDLRYVPRWSNKDVARMANISETTVRKFAQHLIRETNYHFETMENGRDRRYSDHDVMLFIDMAHLSKSKMDIAKCAQVVYARYCTDTDNEAEAEMTPAEVKPDTSLTVRQPKDLLSEIQAASRQFWTQAKTELKREIADEIREEVHSEFTEMKTALEERDKVLLATLREMLEAKQEVAASQESKRKIWWRFGR